LWRGALWSVSLRATRKILWKTSSLSSSFFTKVSSASRRIGWVGEGGSPRRWETYTFPSCRCHTTGRSRRRPLGRSDVMGLHLGWARTRLGPDWSRRRVGTGPSLQVASKRLGLHFHFHGWTSGRHTLVPRSRSWTKAEGVLAGEDKARLDELMLDSEAA